MANLRDEQHPARRDTTPLPAGFRGQDVCSISIVGHGLLARYLLYGDCSCHLFARIDCGTGEKVIGTHVARFAKLRPTAIIIRIILAGKLHTSSLIVRIMENIFKFLPGNGYSEKNCVKYNASNLLCQEYHATYV